MAHGARGWRRTAGACAAGAAIALALGACGGESAASDATPVVSPSATVSPPPDDAPAWFVSRAALEQCGHFGPPNNTLPPDVPDSAWQCLQGADGGELVLVRNSVEGDPVVTYIRVEPGVDGVETISDNRADQFRGEDWTHMRCTSFTSDHELVGCVNA